jgi:predicted DNA-binding transcriptional regulator YafY
MVSACWTGKIVRRAQRLFQLIQILRAARKPYTADELAREVETSKRTIYRDIAALMAERIPIRGEAGIGYVLDAGFDLPPLMLTVDEAEALVLGAQCVASNADPHLAKAADNLKTKILAAVTTPLRRIMLEPAVGTAAPRSIFIDAVDIKRLREAIHAEKKIRISYIDLHGVATERTLWPLSIGYFDSVRLLCAWCELRNDFRHFRTDRIANVDFLQERSPERQRVLKARWNAMQLANGLPLGL